VKQLNYAGYSNWRLPHKYELDDFFRNARSYYDWFNVNGFSNVQADYYWSDYEPFFSSDILSYNAQTGEALARDRSKKGFIWPIRADSQTF